MGRLHLVPHRISDPRKPRELQKSFRLLSHITKAYCVPGLELSAIWQFALSRDALELARRPRIRRCDPHRIDIVICPRLAAPERAASIGLGDDLRLRDECLERRVISRAARRARRDRGLPSALQRRPAALEPELLDPDRVPITALTPVHDPQPSCLPGMNGPRILGYVGEL